MPKKLLSTLHNHTDEALADALGHTYAIAAAAETELGRLKDEFKIRGLHKVVGDHFEVMAIDVKTKRIDMKAVKNFLGNRVGQFEKTGVATRIIVKAADGLRVSALITMQQIENYLTNPHK